MALFVLYKHLLQTRMRSYQVGLDVWFLAGPFRLLPYLMCANGEGSGETPRMRRLAWAFFGRLCDKYHNLMSWLIYPLYFTDMYMHLSVQCIVNETLKILYKIYYIDSLNEFISKKFLSHFYLLTIQTFVLLRSVCMFSSINMLVLLLFNETPKQFISWSKLSPF